MSESGPGPTIQPTPSDQKYDRQIRIWGEKGQQALEQASVCLINACATGTETLKNLVLPGIGSFTVIDGNDVTDADRANNFFLTSPQPTKPRNRALVTVEAMHELNDEVLGSYIPHHVESFINSESSACSFFKRFSIVIVSQMGMGHHVLNHITAACYKLNVPLLIVRSYGLLGYLRIQAREIGVLDSKEDDVAPDLRLYEPFPELREYVNSIHLDQITDTTEISHVPFLVILSKAVSEFKNRYANRLPNSRQEKDEFLEIVKSLRPKICPDGAENFDEAERRSNMRLCYADAAVMTSVMRQLLTDPKSDPNTETGFVAKEETHKRNASPEIIRLGKRASRMGMNVDTDEPIPGSVNSERPLEGAKLINQEDASFRVHAAGVRSFFEKHGCLPFCFILIKIISCSAIPIYSTNFCSLSIPISCYLLEVGHPCYFELAISRVLSISAHRSKLTRFGRVRQANLQRQLDSGC